MSNWLAKNLSTIVNEIALSAAICVRIITHASSIAEIIDVVLGLFRWNRKGLLVTCIVVFESTLFESVCPCPFNTMLFESKQRFKM